MSVIMLSEKHYKTAYNKVCSFRNHRTCDINYCSIFTDMAEGTINLFFRQWYELNYRSYCGRYDKEVDNELLAYELQTINKWSYKTSKEPNCTTIQELKLLQSIRYQIEEDYCYDGMDELQKGAYKVALTVLDRTIDNLTNTIIGTLDEYKQAEWAIN